MLSQRTIAAAFGIALATSGATAWAQNTNVGSDDGGTAARAESTESLVSQLNEARAELERAREQLEAAARGVAVASAVPFQRTLITSVDGLTRFGLTRTSADNRVEAVMPGGAAAEAGIRVGDVIRSIDGEPVERGELLARLADTRPGDTVRFGIERDGEQLEIEVEPRVASYATVGVAPGMRSIIVGPGDGPVVFRAAPLPAVPASPATPASPASPGAPAAAPVVSQILRTFSVASAPLSDMELVPMTEGLSRYFGTSDGLLVVRGPQSDAIDIDDGDVILSINGRTPSSPEHALRILGSYEPGETIEFSIMRDRQQRSVEYLVP